MQSYNKEQKAIVHEGDSTRLIHVMQRAKQGKDLVIGFIGGSITQGYAASKPENSYAQLVLQWFVKQFPTSKVSCVNAAIGGTNSIFGVHRVDADLLEKEPDIIFVEYSVNDMDCRDYVRPYDALLYKLLSQKKCPAVVVFNTMKLDDGKNTQDNHNLIAQKYNLTTISAKNALWEDIRRGDVVYTYYGQDELHPNDTGHARYAQLIIGKLESVRKNSEEMGEIISNVSGLSKCLCPPNDNGYIDAIKWTNRDIQPIINNHWNIDTEGRSQLSDLFNEGWKTSVGGARILFEVEAGCLILQYKKTVNHGGSISVKIDGNEKEFVIDSDFSNGWGDTVGEVLLYDLEKGSKHCIDIIMQNSASNYNKFFYITALLVSKR